MSDFIKLHLRESGSVVYYLKSTIIRIFDSGENGAVVGYGNGGEDCYDSVKETAEEIMAMLGPQPVPSSLPFVVKPEDEPDTYTWHEAMEAFDENPNSQWRLPTREELTKMYKNRKKIGGFIANCYWSSSEDLNNYSWLQQFSDGAQYVNYKPYSFAVRLLRKNKPNA